VRLANDAPIREAIPRAPLAAVAIAAMAESWIEGPVLSRWLAGGAIREETGGDAAAVEGWAGPAVAARPF
jgi:hypothetical protein